MMACTLCKLVSGDNKILLIHTPTSKRQRGEEESRTARWWKVIGSPPRAGSWHKLERGLYLFIYIPSLSTKRPRLCLMKGIWPHTYTHTTHTLCMACEELKHRGYWLARNSLSKKCTLCLMKMWVVFFFIIIFIMDHRSHMVLSSQSKVGLVAPKLSHISSQST